MNTGFSFTLTEVNLNLTKVSFCAEHRDIVEHIFESYEYDISEDSDTQFLVEDNLDEVMEELLDYEIIEDKLLLEEDGFILTPSDLIYEIESVTQVNEGVAKRTLVVRKGKRKVIFKCGPGQMKVGRSCRRRPSTQLLKMKRRAKVSARKARRKRKMTNRKRKISMRRRAMLVRKPKPHTAMVNKPKHK